MEGTCNKYPGSARGTNLEVKIIASPGLVHVMLFITCALWTGSLTCVGPSREFLGGARSSSTLSLRLSGFNYCVVSVVVAPSFLCTGYQLLSPGEWTLWWRVRVATSWFVQRCYWRGWCFAAVTRVCGYWCHGRAQGHLVCSTPPPCDGGQIIRADMYSCQQFSWANCTQHWPANWRWATHTYMYVVIYNVITRNTFM